MGQPLGGTQGELNTDRPSEGGCRVPGTWASHSGSVGSEELPLVTSSVTLGKLTSLSASPLLSHTNKDTFVPTCEGNGVSPGTAMRVKGRRGCKQHMINSISVFAVISAVPTMY